MGSAIGRGWSKFSAAARHGHSASTSRSAVSLPSAKDSVARIRRWSLIPTSTLAVFAQPVGGLIARCPGGRDIHQHLQPVEVVGRFRAEQFVVEHLDVRDVVRARRAGAAPDPVRRRAIRARARPSGVASRPARRTPARWGWWSSAGRRTPKAGPGRSRSPCRWNTEPCSKPAPILCTLTTHTSAPASIAQVGRSSWKGRWAPHASSTISGLPRSWHTSAIAAMSAQVPYGLGLTISAPGGVGVFVPRVAVPLRRRRVREVPVGVPARRDPPRLHAGEDQTGDDRLVAVAPDQQAAVTARRRPSSPPSPTANCRRWRSRRVGADRVGHQLLGALEVSVR